MARPAFSFLISPDSQLLEDELARQTRTCMEAPEKWERHVFWGDEEPGPKFWNALAQQGLFDARRLIIARHAHEWPASVWKGLSSALATVPATVWPILCLEAEYERGKFKIPAHILKARCLAYAEKQGWVWRQPPLQGPSLRKYIENAAKKLGLKFGASAMALFCDSVSPDARAIMSELRKLKLASENGQINEDMITREASSPQSDAFVCIKKLESGDLNGAWKECARSSATEILFFLLALMARELRILWQLQTGGPPPKMYPPEAAMKKNLAQAMGAKRIADGFSLLAETEWRIKSGRLSPEQALEFFLIECCGLFNGARQSRH